jgi:Ca2+-binding EF-hand superfamily protein
VCGTADAGLYDAAAADVHSRAEVEVCATKGQPEPAATDATFRKYDGGGKGHLAREEVATMMVALGYEVTDKYIDGLLDIYGSEVPYNKSRVLVLEGFKLLSRSLGAHDGSETLEAATFHKYDTGGKGHLTAGEVASLLADLEYDVDGEYIAGLLEIYGDEEGVLDPDGFNEMSQHLGVEELKEQELHQASPDAKTPAKADDIAATAENEEGEGFIPDRPSSTSQNKNKKKDKRRQAQSAAETRRAPAARQSPVKPAAEGATADKVAADEAAHAAICGHAATSYRGEKASQQKLTDLVKQAEALEQTDARRAKVLYEEALAGFTAGGSPRPRLAAKIAAADVRITAQELKVATKAVTEAISLATVYALSPPKGHSVVPLSPSKNMVTTGEKLASAYTAEELSFALQLVLSRPVVDSEKDTQVAHDF